MITWEYLNAIPKIFSAYGRNDVIENGLFEAAEADDPSERILGHGYIEPLNWRHRYDGYVVAGIGGNGKGFYFGQHAWNIVYGTPSSQGVTTGEDGVARISNDEQFGIELTPSHARYNDIVASDIDDLADGAPRVILPTWEYAPTGFERATAPAPFIAWYSESANLYFAAQGYYGAHMWVGNPR